MIIAKTTIVGAIINFIVDLILISKIGLYAASLSTLISYAIVALYRAYDIKKIVLIRWNKKFIISLIGAYLVVLIAYYSQILVIEIAALIFAIVYAIIINREFIIGIYNEGMMILKKR